MHDIWSPWHGCKKKSEGCKNCYMYYLDKIHGNKDGSVIYKTQHMNYPIQRTKNHEYKIKSGEQLRVCMSSDFFLEEADIWREEAFHIMRIRKDVIFFLLTKRIERAHLCLPKDISDFQNISLNVSCENQKRADERIPILLSLPIHHLGIMCAPLLGNINIEKYLQTNKIENVIVGGENYDGARPCHFEWIQNLQKQCVKYNVKFTFIETGTNFYKDNKQYILKSKDLQSLMAYKSNLNFEGKKIEYQLYDEWYNLIPKEELLKPYFKEKCQTCASKPICNGCDRCGKCDKIKKKG